MRHKAIYNTHPKVVQIDGETDAFDKDWNKVELDEAKVTEEVKRLEAEYDAKQYQRDRSVAYDPIPEQLDQIYHDIDGWKARIKSVKDKYPKPSK
jgi:hypothetical protein